MSTLAHIATAWVLIGMALVACTRSRGLAADAQFILTWPIHLIQHLRGKE